ncbi:zinc finger CW-type PWWP domain protein 2-like [Mobula birostris]|uniref:zinc finger CW-type PWWP domain protein 2-like n=1 Tax=Mobula birostris TaxID=1983395 RepID=UPI003B27CFB3
MDLFDKGSYADKVWIQCEYEDCLKWRLLTKEGAACVDLSLPWYCDMNSDSSFNCCSVLEESFPKKNVFHQHGLKLVYSQLPVGSLVITKVPGWPRWPSILCTEGLTGEYVIYDKDGYVEQYHTEFLGKPHTRSWISVGQVEPYYTRGKLAEHFKRSTQWYKSALEEARMLSELTIEERLKMCKLSNDALKKSDSRKSREIVRNKSTSGEKEKMVKDHQKSKRWIRQPTSRKHKRKIRRTTQETSLTIGQNDILALANETNDILQAENLLQDLEKMLKQINDSDKLAHSFMLEKQDGGKIQGQKNKLSNWSVAASEEIELLDFTGAEDCTVIDGIEFRTGKYIEEIANQLKEIDVIMAEMEGYL